jgi:hypothetical protein
VAYVSNQLAEKGLLKAVTAILPGKRFVSPGLASNGFDLDLGRK